MFTFFSTLKFNFAAMMTFKEIQFDFSSLSAILITIASFVIPFVLARLLYKNRDCLERLDNQKKFKTLIEGRNIQKKVWI